MNDNHRLARLLLGGGGATFLVLTLGLFLQQPWATGLWPWPDGRLSYIFLSSILAAVAVPMIWIGWSGELGAVKGGALNLGAAALGTTVHLAFVYARSRQPAVLVAAIAFAFFTLLNAAVYFWGRGIRLRDPRSMPAPVRGSFLLFSVLLVAFGGQLVLLRPIFPWPLKPESSVIFGFIFLGAAVYFGHAFAHPLWHNARGPLLGFLAYDLVLIGPFLAHFNSVLDEHRLSLIIYVGVLVFSGALAIYYLFLAPPTRAWSIEAAG